MGKLYLYLYCTVLEPQPRPKQALDPQVLGPAPKGKAKTGIMCPHAKARPRLNIAANL